MGIGLSLDLGSPWIHPEQSSSRRDFAISRGYMGFKEFCLFIPDMDLKIPDFPPFLSYLIPNPIPNSKPHPAPCIPSIFSLKNTELSHGFEG